MKNDDDDRDERDNDARAPVVSNFPSSITRTLVTSLFDITKNINTQHLFARVFLFVIQMKREMENKY